MTSQKQIEANRANAQKSTGPNTSEGKSKSRLNAIRDNITGQITTLNDADRAAEMNIFALAAETPAENPDLIEEEETDPELQSATSDANVYLTQARRLELTSLYEQRMNRSLHRNRTELHDLQAERRRKYETDRKEEVLLARFEDLKDKAYQAPAIPSRNGSVFSSEEISRAAERQRNLEAAQYLLNNKAPWAKYGSTGSGSPDLFAEVPYRTPPDCIPAKIHGVSPESIAIRKFYYPEEFKRKQR